MKNIRRNVLTISFSFNEDFTALNVSRSITTDFCLQASWENNSSQFHNKFFYIYRSDPFNCRRPYMSKQNANINNLFPPPPHGFAFHHGGSFDELSSTKFNRFPRPNEGISFVEPPKAQQYQWPKVIPKSPSSFSMNSFRLQRQPPFNGKCPQNYNPIDEFDLDKIESSFRQSHSTLLKENVNRTDFGTAV